MVCTLELIGPSRSPGDGRDALQDALPRVRELRLIPFRNAGSRGSASLPIATGSAAGVLKVIVTELAPAFAAVTARA